MSRHCFSKVGQIWFFLAVCFSSNEAHSIRREFGWIKRSGRQFATAAFTEHFDRTLGNEANTKPRFNEFQDRLPAADFEGNVEGLLRGPIAPVFELLSPGSIWFGQNERESSNSEATTGWSFG